jgi:tryptophan 2,3-dioxygenase
MREIELLLGLELSERKAHGHGDPLLHILKTAEKSGRGEDITGRIRAAKEGPSLRDAIHSWLYRTPIQGSTVGDPGDEKIVRSFLSNYLSAVREQNERQIRRFVLEGGSEEGIRKRFGAALDRMEQFLFAGDVGEEQRGRALRIRAGVLFIESYRELPLLSWPRLLLDTVVRLEELFITFRFRHARMVERIIGSRVGTGGSPGVDYLDATTKYRIFKDLWAVRTLLLEKAALPKLENPEFFKYYLDI